MKESSNNFDVWPLMLEQYIPLPEVLKLTPSVSDNALEDVYTYYR